LVVSVVIVVDPYRLVFREQIENAFYVRTTSNRSFPRFLMTAFYSEAVLPGRFGVRSGGVARPVHVPPLFEQCARSPLHIHRSPVKLYG